jgi:CheY-like chemotaxis protein
MNECKKVLIVDDDESIRETMQLALELRGYEVVTAGNGKEGIEALEHSPFPCVILLDLMMPVMDGWGFVERLERDPALGSIPVVVVTAFAERADSIKAERVIAKPVTLEVLYKTVRSFCDGDSSTAHVTPAKA